MNIISPVFKAPLSLRARHWYAMLLIWPSGGVDASPVWLFEAPVVPKGRKPFELHFWHLNYPDGVQEKHFQLKKLRHDAGILVAEEAGSSSQKRLLLVSEITDAWLRQFFQITPVGGLEQYLANLPHP